MFFRNEYRLILFNMNYDFLYYFSLTRSWEPEPKLHAPAPALATSFGSLQLRLHNTEYMWMPHVLAAHAQHQKFYFIIYNWMLFSP